MFSSLLEDDEEGSAGHGDDGDEEAAGSSEEEETEERGKQKEPEDEFTDKTREAEFSLESNLPAEGEQDKADTSPEGRFFPHNSFI